MKPVDAVLPHSMSLRLGVLAISSLAAIYIAFLMETREQMVLVQGKLGYLATAAAFVFALLALLLKFRSSGLTLDGLAGRIRPHLAVLVLIPVLVFGALSLAPAKIRILADEASLLGVSLAMHETHENIQWTQGVYFHGQGYQPATYQYDKRAPGYPFLLSMSYELTGYRYRNAFLINAIAGGLVLLLTYHLTQRRLGRAGGALAMAALASFPVFWFSVSSAGFETLNLLFLMLGLLAADQLDRSRSWEDVLLLIAASSLVGLFRYESVLFACAFFLFVLYRAPRHQLASMPWLLTLAPLAYVATGWQVFVPFATEVPADIKAFSVANLVANIGHSVRFLANLGTTESGSPMAFFTAAAALPFLFRPSRLTALISAPDRAVLGLFGICYLGWSIIVLCYWHGNFENTITMRLCLPALPVIGLAAAFLLNQLPRSTGRHGLHAVLAIVMLAWTSPALVRVADHAENETSVVFNATAEILERHYRDKNVLIVSSGTGWFSALQAGSVNFGTFDGNTEQFLQLRRAGLLDEIIVIELFDGPSHQPRPRNRLRQPLPTTSLLTVQVGPSAILRLARVNVVESSNQ